MTANRNNKFGDYNPDKHDISNKIPTGNGSQNSLDNQADEESYSSDHVSKGKIGAAPRTSNHKIIAIYAGIAFLLATIYFSNTNESTLPPPNKTTTKAVSPTPTPSTIEPIPANKSLPTQAPITTATRNASGHRETYVSIYFTEGRNGGGFGQGPSIEAAKKAALNSCLRKYSNEKCAERLSGAGRCLAVANNGTGTIVTAGIGDTPDIAIENAMRSCKAKYQGCYVPRQQSKCDIN